MRQRAEEVPRERDGCEPETPGGAPRRALAAAGSLTTLLALLLPGTAAAQRSEGTILRIDSHELLVDLGDDDGVVPGDPVRIYRRIVVEHPLTHEALEDRFPIGEEQLEQIGGRMSTIVLDAATFTHAPTVGDSVVVLRGAPPPPPPEPVAPCPVCEAPACPEPTPCPVDAEALEVLAAFESSLGKPLDRRIAVWEGYLALHPNAPWSFAVGRELENLRALLRAQRGGTPGLSASGPARLGHDPPEIAFLGEPVEILLAIDPRAALQLAQLHVRRRGERAFTTSDMELDGDHYLRGRIPDEFVVAGGFEYFVVGVTTRGEEVALGGTSTAPVRVPTGVREQTPPVRTDRSHLQASLEYVDFQAADFARDYYLRFETDFRYVVGTWFYGLRMGFGIIDGSGGPVELIDRPPSDPRRQEVQPVSYRYAFTEMEFRIHELFYLLGRISFGSAAAYVLPDGRSEAPEALVGGHGRLRIGRPTGTNLELGGGYIEDLGYEATVSVNLGILDEWPMRGHVIVTDMPVRADVGVRLVAEVGWRPLSWLAVNALLGYDIRTITHAGLSAGLGTVFQW